MNKKVMTSLKISIAAILSITLAEMFHLNYTISAGVVAILTVAPTKKETIKTAFNRFLAYMIAIVIASICYNTIGYNLIAFYVYLIIYAIVCQQLNYGNSIAVNSVLISHFITEGVINIPTIANETAIFVIGATFGVLVNLHLKKNSNYILQMQLEADEQIKQILLRISQRILDNNLDNYTGECFQNLNISIQKAKLIAHENFMNQFTNKDKHDIEYITMREKQIHVLYSIYKRASVIHTKPVTAQNISKFLEKISLSYNKDNTVEDLLEEFYSLHSELKLSPLPIERLEFEDRAELYVMMRDIEEFLKLKKEFIENNKVDVL